MSLTHLSYLLNRSMSGAPDSTEDEIRTEMLDYLRATSDDAKAVLAGIADDYAELTLSEDGTTVLVDTADPTAPDGLGRTYYLTLTEIPR